MAPFFADFLLYVHVLWVLFMILGLPLALLLRKPWIRWVHAAGLLSYLGLASLNWWCPLTLGEEYFRQIANPGFSYHGSFLAHWLERIIYVENWGAPLWVFRILAALYLLLVASTWFWLDPKTLRRYD